MQAVPDGLPWKYEIDSAEPQRATSGDWLRGVSLWLTTAAVEVEDRSFSEAFQRFADSASDRQVAELEPWEFRSQFRVAPGMSAVALTLLHDWLDAWNAEYETANGETQLQLLMATDDGSLGVVSSKSRDSGLALRGLRSLSSFVSRESYEHLLQALKIVAEQCSRKWESLTEDDYAWAARDLSKRVIETSTSSHYGAILFARRVIEHFALEIEGTPSANESSASVEAAVDVRLLLGEISARASDVAVAERALYVAVQTARDAGASWRQIGEMAGISKQAANERWDQAARARKADYQRRRRGAG